MFANCRKFALAPAGAAITFTANGLADNTSTKVGNASVSAGKKLLCQSRVSFATNVAKPMETRTSTTKTKPFSVLEWYEKHLESNPIRTKMITGSFLWGLGDLVAQVVPPLAAAFSSDEEEKPSKSMTLADYDFARTGRAVFFGFAIHAPASHVHFNFLESLTVRAGVTGLGIPVFKAFMEQFVYWSWFSNTLYHGAMGAMQFQGPTEIYNRIADVLWETQKAQWVFWIPIQLLNFKFVPVRHQLNVVLVTSVVWTALLSAWYPPAKEEGEQKEEAIKEN